MPRCSSLTAWTPSSRAFVRRGHDNTGHTADGAGMLPPTALGYHTLPKAVLSCTLCHEQKNLGWTATHQ